MPKYRIVDLDAKRWEFKVEPTLPFELTKAFEAMLYQEVRNQRFENAEHLRAVIQSLLNRLSQ